MSSYPVTDGTAGATRAADRRSAAELARSTLAYAAERDYVGWDYSDGMSSRVRRAIPGENRWLNLAFQEVIKRAPVNLRPLLLVEQRRNFKGASLFALAHRNLHLAPSDDDVFDHRAEVTRLADWLVEHRCRGYGGFCGGHRHANQHLDHRTLPAEPDVVATSYAVKALLAAGAYDGGYEDVARSAEAFLVEDMNYREVDGGAKVDYYPKDRADHYTLNAGAIAARALLDLYGRVPDDALLERATALLDYVASRQTDRGGWYYRDPPSASHLSMDTHHNGFVVECLQRYGEVVGDGRYADTLEDGFEFLRESLFDPDGAPNWDESAAYPRDIHAAAQGILVCSRAGDLSFARCIIDWTVANLHAGGGQFHFRRHRYYTKRVTLMRWCQAWMAYALSTYHLTAATGESVPTRRSD